MDDRFWLNLLRVLDVIGQRYAARAVRENDVESFRRCAEIVKAGIAILGRLKTPQARHIAQDYYEAWAFGLCPSLLQDQLWR